MRHHMKISINIIKTNDNNSIVPVLPIHAMAFRANTREIYGSTFGKWTILLHEERLIKKICLLFLHSSVMIKVNSTTTL